MHQDNQNHLHIPVLLQQTLQYLDPKQGERYLDLTAGYGGHAAEVMERTQNYRGSVLVDRDSNAITELRKRFEGRGVDIRQADFLSASRGLHSEGKQFDLILADLGVSSPHLNQASRGFSLQNDGPLDMRMDQTQSLTAAEVVNTYPEKKLAEIIAKYGEDPKSHRIASLIVHNRPLQTTNELAHIVARAWPGHSKVHPATRTFQALRIVVNDELAIRPGLLLEASDRERNHIGAVRRNHDARDLHSVIWPRTSYPSGSAARSALRKSLPIWLDNLLAPGGRIVVISFHSLEDRIVKNALKAESGDRYDAHLQLLTKRPISGDETEIVFNPRARSAKLRAACKQK